MKKIILITASVLAMSCSSNAHEAGSDATHHAQIGTIHASGTGHAAQAPDQASVSAGVVTEGATAGEAMRKNATLMTSTFAALKKAGIAEKNIQTSQMSLQPRYDYQNRQKPRITGYEVRNTVSAKSEDLEKVGPMLDALVEAGVNNINGVTFSIKDSKSAQDKARIDAIKAAQTKAEGMAKAAGVKLGKIMEIRESSSGHQPPQPMMMRAMADSAESTPIAAGEQTLSVTVNLTYVIDQ
ncbi:MAG: SIMPL domain-containing protein [Acidimicrobiales bacterium]|nr:SIMPL domain-containing protein [Hyphomonadaceae bacterium]RZV41238.1 MAG: SIMPL domain-containing protein [Acidimicrobiales bacterium]